MAFRSAFLLANFQSLTYWLKTAQRVQSSLTIQRFHRAMTARFFDAWVLADGAVSVDLTKAKAIATSNLNSLAKAEAQHRFTNTSIGLDNILTDADWIALLNTARSAITASADTTALVASVAPVNAAIEANK